MALVIELAPEVERELREAAARTGQAPEDFARDAVEAKLAEQPRPIWEVFAQGAQELPTEVVARLPADGSENLRHYLDGWPKGTQ